MASAAMFFSDALTPSQTDIPFKIAASLTGDTAEGDAFIKNVLLNPKYLFTYEKCQDTCLF